MFGGVAEDAFFFGELDETFGLGLINGPDPGDDDEDNEPGGEAEVGEEGKEAGKEEIRGREGRGGDELGDSR